MEEQFTRLICLAYQGKQNGSVLSTNNQCAEQVEQHTNSSNGKMYGPHSKYRLKSS